MDTKTLIEAVIRWGHVIAGIIWIGHLYFFNWVNGPFAATLDKAHKQKVVPELMPRALFWFRWGAAWTWITGVLLLGLVYYMNKGVLFPASSGPGDVPGWGAGSGVMVLLVFLAPFLYEPFVNKLGKDGKVFYWVGLVLTAAYIAGFTRWAGLSYRGATIHVGATFGTIMAWNVWVRIWPAQQKIIAAIKAGEAPDAALAGLAGLRSKHNTYMSVPLVWAMLNLHTVSASGLVTDGFAMLAATAIGWLFVTWMYKKGAAVKGM